MIFPRPVVTAEGAACLDFLSPQRPGVEDKPTPSGRVHNGDLIVDFCGQTVSPPSCGSLLRKGNGSYGFHLQRRAADTFCHDDLSGGPYIGKVIYRLHVIDKHGVISSRQPLHQLRDLHAGPDLLRKREPVVPAAAILEFEGSIFLPNPFAQNSSGNCITFYHKPAHDNGEGGVLFFIDYYPDDCYIRDSYFGIQILDFEHN